MGRSVNFEANVRLKCFVQEIKIRSSQPTAVSLQTLLSQMLGTGGAVSWIIFFVIYKTQKNVFEHISKHR